MLEIEQKYARADFPALERRLAELGVRPGEEVVEADQYFNGPDRDFARTGEAFRLRRVGKDNFLTYRGRGAGDGGKARGGGGGGGGPGGGGGGRGGGFLRYLGY